MMLAFLLDIEKRQFTIGREELMILTVLDLMPLCTLIDKDTLHTNYSLHANLALKLSVIFSIL